VGRLDLALPLNGRVLRGSAFRPAPEQMSVEDAIDRHLWRRLVLLWRWPDERSGHLRARLTSTINVMLALGLLDSHAAELWTARIERATARRRGPSARRDADNAGDAHLAQLVERVQESAKSQFASDVVRLFSAAGTLELAGLVSARSAENARAAARRQWWARQPPPRDSEHREPGRLRRVVVGPRQRAGALLVTSVEIHDAGLSLNLHHDGALDPPPLARPWPTVLRHFPDLPTQLTGPALNDDRGTRYTITTLSATSSSLQLADVWTGTMTAQPAPPHAARRLVLTYANRTIGVRL
jgi:hypothetical protein